MAEKPSHAMLEIHGHFHVLDSSSRLTAAASRVPAYKIHIQGAHALAERADVLISLFQVESWLRDISLKHGAFCVNRNDFIVVFSPNFQGDWSNGDETALTNVQACSSVTQTPGSSVTFEPQGVTSFALHGHFPPDPTTISAELDGVKIALAPLTTANTADCNEVLYNIALPPTLHNLTFTFTGPASNNNFFALHAAAARPSTTTTVTSSTTANATSASSASVIPSSASSASLIPSSASSASVIPSSTSSALPVIDTEPQSSHSKTRAKLGGAIGSTAPAPGASPDHEFVFLPLFAPITFRGKKLQNVQITIVLEAANLAVTDNIPRAPSTYELTPTRSRHDVQVAWKVITLCEGKLVLTVSSSYLLLDSRGKGSDPDSLTERLRTVVTKTIQYWKPAKLRDRKLAATVLAKNAAGIPQAFALGICLFAYLILPDIELRLSGTYHVKPSHSFSPFLVIREVQYRDGQLCTAPQCGDLRINAYITENIQERQILYDEFYDSEPSCPIVSAEPPSTAGEEEESDLAPGPTDEEDVDESRKIFTPVLLGESGKLVSTLQQRTQWHLVEERGELRLIVGNEEV
ncbi:hypothetical protein B0H19DRAFT_1083949 [Mycena capillaripes]|nr:hypothetical protein B0H19DRAFT_1083949 [Mycena capillaripes]